MPVRTPSCHRVGGRGALQRRLRTPSRVALDGEVARSAHGIRPNLQAGPETTFPPWPARRRRRQRAELWPSVLATPCPEHSRAEALPGPRAVQGVAAAAVRLPGVLGAAATRAAGDDTTDRAQLHPRIVDGVAGTVYSPAVLRLRDHVSRILYGESFQTPYSPGPVTSRRA